MANNEVKASIVVDLDEKGVVVGARNINQSVDNMTRKMINSTNKINAQYRGMNKNMGGTANQLNQFTKRMASGYLGAQGIKRTWEFNDGLREMQRNFGLNTEEIEQYKNALFEIQWQYGVNKTAFGAYINEVAKGVKTYEELEEKAKLGAIAMAGLGLDGKQSADLMRAMEKANIQNPEAMMNTFANQGQNRNGRFNGAELAVGTMEVMGSASGLSKDETTMTQVSAILQALSEESGDIGEAVRMLSSVLADFDNGDFRKFAKNKVGKDVFDVDKEGKLVFKDLMSLFKLMAEDTKKGEYSKGLYYDQLRTLMGKLSPESAKAIMELGGKGDRVEEIKKSRGADVRGLAVDRSRNFSNSTEKLMAVLERLADQQLAEPIERFALALSQLDAHDIQNILNGVKEGAEGLKLILAAFVGAKGLDMIKNIDIKGGGTIMMSVVVGKFMIDYLSNQANERQDKADYQNADSMEIINNALLLPLQKYLTETGQGSLDPRLLADLEGRVNMWSKQGLYQNPQDVVVAAGSFLQENIGRKSHQMLLNAQDDRVWKGFARPSNQPSYSDPEKNLDIINRNKFDFKESADREAITKELAKAINIKSVIKDQLESIEFKKQQVDVKIDVRSEKGLQVTSVKKESTVNTPEKLGKFTGGMP